MKKNSIYIYILLCVTALGLVSCHHNAKAPMAHKEGNIELLRFEKMIFDTPPAQLQQVLQQHYTEYACNLLNVNPGDPQLLGQLVGFVQDAPVRELYDSVQHHYDNLYWLEEDLTKAIKRGKDAGLDLNYTKYITFVSAYLDYEHRVAADGTTLLIALDQYVVGRFEKYGYFGLPMYLVNLSDSAHLATDCMAAIGRQLVELPESELTMLDYMIAEGKMLCFLDEVMPRTPDTLKIRYSDSQMQWMRNNEANVWSYFIQNQMLFDKDMNHFQNFIDEAPKTNAFKDSAPRTAQYIGWQIVKAYMHNTKTSLAELMHHTNAKQILDQSGYHPR